VVNDDRYSATSWAQHAGHVAAIGGCPARGGRSRELKRLEPLPGHDEAVPALSTGVAAPADPDRAPARRAVRRALSSALAGLEPRARLRLALYYTQDLTLSRLGGPGESEATASRKLAAARKAIREDVERRLRHDARLSAQEVVLAFRARAERLGFDLRQALLCPRRKESDVDRSNDRGGQVLNLYFFTTWHRSQARGDLGLEQGARCQNHEKH